MESKQLSDNFCAADLCCVGETWHRTRIVNAPLQSESWAALSDLSNAIFEPVLAQFGRPDITYGFTSLALLRAVKSHSAPKLDQHASYETNLKGKLICERGGAAADFLIEGLSSLELAIWVAENLPFDRVYFYGVARPIHVSFCLTRSAQIVTMLAGPSGRRIPRIVQVNGLKALL